MSEETVVKFKIATITTAFLSIVSIAVTIMGFYVASISATVNNNSKDIATLMESKRNVEDTQKQILTKLDEIRKDQILRKVKERN
jgi:hypothetical protein